jgi:argininosuccinate synthase
VVRPAVDPIHLDIRFDDGVPVSINGVEMTLTELLESIETITGEPALGVLQRVGAAESRPADPQLA